MVVAEEDGRKVLHSSYVLITPRPDPLKTRALQMVSAEVSPENYVICIVKHRPSELEWELENIYFSKLSMK